MRTTALLSATLATILVPFPAVAFEFTIPGTDQEVSFEITETIVGDYHDENYDKLDTNDKYGDIRNRLNLKLEVADFNFSARFDTATFISAPGDADPPYLDRYGLEKISAGYMGRDLKATLGDVYGSFGRGIALRIRKTDQLAEDTTLMGAKIRARLGPVEITGLSGLVNPTNTDGITEKTLSDYYALKTDILSGLQAKWRVDNQWSIGIHCVGAFIDPFDKNDEAGALVDFSILPDKAIVAGASAEAHDVFEMLDLYAEFNWMEKDLVQADLPQASGWALFFGSNLYLDNWTFTAELKSYDHYELYGMSDGGNYTKTRLDYIRPPTLEPEDMEIHNNRDITGARLKIDWRPGASGTLLFASYAGFRALDTYASGEEWWVYNTRLGAEQEIFERGLAKLDVGLREEIPILGGGDTYHLIYMNASVKIPLGTRHSLDVHGNNWWGHEHVTALDSSRDYLKGEWTLGYSWSPLLSVSLIVGYDTQPSGSRSMDVFYQSQTGSPIRQVFLAGSLTLNIESMLVLKLLGGQLRGGQKCINGSCRIFPPFSGVRLEATFRI